MAKLAPQLTPQGMGVSFVGRARRKEQRKWTMVGRELRYRQTETRWDVWAQARDGWLMCGDAVSV
jgi:hypothetical protein